MTYSIFFQDIMGSFSCSSRLSLRIVALLLNTTCWMRHTGRKSIPFPIVYRSIPNVQGVYAKSLHFSNMNLANFALPHTKSNHNEVSVNLRLQSSIWMLARSITINLHQQNFTALQFYLDLEAKFCEALVLKRNQVFVKTASKQPQETKCIFNIIFE